MPAKILLKIQESLFSFAIPITLAGKNSEIMNVPLINSTRFIVLILYEYCSLKFLKVTEHKKGKNAFTAKS